MNAPLRGDPALTKRLKGQLKLPVFSGPMFIASTADLVIAQCRAGVIGAMPALNPRTSAALDADITRIKASLRDGDAPFAINLVGHRSNDRLDADLAIVIKHKVPIVVLALAADGEIVKAVHAYGGIVFNDVISNRQALKCADLGVDGIIAVCAGAGGHTGRLSPFALVSEIREWWQGPLALSGCIATGRGILAAEAMGADLAYIGSAFLASHEANTQPGFKQMIIDGCATDVVVTNSFTGVDASFLKPSILANGLDPATLVRAAGTEISIKDGGSNARAWRDIWSAGQGIGAIKASGPASAYIDRLAAEYAAARAAFT